MLFYQQVDKYYHEDIVDWHSSKKLKYIADKTKDVNDKKQGKEKFKKRYCKLYLKVLKKEEK